MPTLRGGTCRSTEACLPYGKSAACSGMCCIYTFRTNGVFYGFAEVADWRAFHHFEQALETPENRRCNTSCPNVP
jgi:hypothetical protein